VGEGRVFGRHPVLELLRGGGRRADEVAVLAGGAGPLDEIVALARRAGVKVSYRTREQLTAMAGSDRHQGAVARVAAAEYADLGELGRLAAVKGEAPFFLVLDQVQDPRNFGAVLRTAEAFGVHGVLVGKHHQAGLTDAVARTAMGALVHVPVARETNLVRSIEELKKSGVWIYGATPGRGAEPWRVDLTTPVCLVVGSEGSGLRPLVARACDAIIAIPTVGRVGALNVSAAAAILCYEVRRQRSPGVKNA